MGKGGQKPKRTEPPIWTPEWAYFVGLVTADGCLSKDGRHISIVSKDKELLEQVKNKFGFAAKIAVHRGSQFNTRAWHIQIGDVCLYRWLFTLGLTPKKSKTIQSVNVPPEFFLHFLRGLFDGDGTVYSYWDPRYPNSFMYYVSFTSASPPFLDWLQRKIYTLYALKGHFTDGTRAGQLKYAKNEARALLFWMYFPSTIFLKRKLKKTFKIWINDMKVARAHSM